MASAARLRDIRRVDMRHLVSGRQNVMLAVAIGTGRNIFVLADLNCTMPLINLGFIRMAFAAIDRGQDLVMREFFDSGVAIGAGKITVD